MTMRPLGPLAPSANPCTDDGATPNWQVSRRGLYRLMVRLAISETDRGSTPDIGVEVGVFKDLSIAVDHEIAGQ